MFEHRARIAIIAAVSLLLLALPAFASTTSHALVQAAKGGNTFELTTLLRHGANPNAYDLNSPSALEWAAAKGNVDAVLALLNAHAAVDGSPTLSRYTPLMRAASFGRERVVVVLVAHGAHVNARTINGQTALDFAQGRHPAIAAFLKKHGATRGIAMGPQALCNAGNSLGKEVSAWQSDPKASAQFFCNIVDDHHFLQGAGNLVLYTYQVSGTEGTPQLVFIEAHIDADPVPKDELAKTLTPILQAVFADRRKGEIPADLLAALASVTDVRQDTRAGLVTATYTPGDDARWPSIGSSYVIRIRLH